MIWIFIRTFLVTPVVFLVAAPILLAVGLHAALEGRSREAQRSG
jgi:hypothetical protein